MTLTRRHFLALSTAALSARPGHSQDIQVIGGDAFGSYWRGIFPGELQAGDVEAVVSRIVAEVNRQMYLC